MCDAGVGEFCSELGDIGGQRGKECLSSRVFDRSYCVRHYTGNPIDRVAERSQEFRTYNVLQVQLYRALGGLPLPNGREGGGGDFST